MLCWGFFSIFTKMLELIKTDAVSNIVVTLELATKPYFIFKFVHVTTKETITFVAGADLSLYPYRYNEFAIQTATLFGTKKEGEWHYIVYQSNTADITVQDDPLEYGKMFLISDSAPIFTPYQGTPTTFKSYGN